jgi:hypothetical protein
MIWSISARLASVFCWSRLDKSLTVEGFGIDRAFKSVLGSVFKLDGDIVLALPGDLEPCLLEGSHEVGPVVNPAFGYFLECIGVQQLQGLFLRSGILSEFPGLDEPGPGWVVWPGPTVGDVPAVAERVEMLLPAWGKSVHGLPGRKLGSWYYKMQFVVSGVLVSDP